MKYVLLIDNPQHYAYILGGMWGFKRSMDKNLAKKIFNRMLNKRTAVKYDKNSKKAYDQHFLRDKVYSLIRYKSIIHDSYTCRYFFDGEPFPTQRNGDCYIGGIGVCNLTASSFFVCPSKCRPSNHLEWKYC